MEIVNITHHEDHTAEMVVKLDQETVEKALQKAARKVAKNYRFPGFRPGKAPYKVIEAAVGREGLLNEVLDDLGDEMYRFGLQEADIEPYALGEVKDLNTEDNSLTITFVVAKRPEVELNAYRDIRVDYEEEDITDEQVERGVDMVYNNLALTETVERAAEFGDQVILNIHGFLAREDGETRDDDVDVEEDDREVYMHEHDHAVILFEDESMDTVMPGFSAEIVGLEAGAEKEFSLTFGDADDVHEELRGKTVDFEINVEKVSARIVPEKTDLVATLASDGDVNTLDELAVKVRESLEENAQESTRQRYLNKVIEALVEQATIHYPKAMLDDYLEKSLEDMDAGLRRNYGLTLDDYIRIADKSREALMEERREQAEQDLKTTLVLQQVATEEDLFLDESQLDAAIEKELAQYGELAGALRNVLYQGEQRENFGSRVVSDRVTSRLIDIAKGLDPQKGPDPEADEEIEVSADTEPGPVEAETVEDIETDVAEE